MNKSLKYLGILFALVMLFSVFAISACKDEIDNGSDNESEYGQPTEGLTYVLNNDGQSYRCTGIDTATKTYITIASYYNDLPVTSIGDGAFVNYTKLVRITIPDSITSIGYQAFCGCINIKSITIPNSVTSIGFQAFCGCTSIKSIIIPDGVINIGGRAFEDCTSLASIEISGSVTSIGVWAFKGCKSLVNVMLSENSQLTSIGEEAFHYTPYYNNENNWENKVLYLDNYLIATKADISGSFTIKSGTKLIADFAFYRSRSLASVTIPDSVAYIGMFAFEGCTSLANVNFGENSQLTSIGNGAFYNCESLICITIPDSVTSIGGNAFAKCGSLNAVYITDIAHWLEIKFSDVTANPLCCARNLYLNDELVNELNIPDSVTSIGNYAFSGCTSLESVTVGENSQLTSIGSGAFNNCNRLIRIEIPDSITSIRDYAFFYCTSLESINFKGTIEKWNSIIKYFNWDLDTAKYTIYCEDGEITKNGAETKY